MIGIFQNQRWNVMESLKQTRLIRREDHSSSLGKEGLYPSLKLSAVLIIWKKLPTAKLLSFSLLWATQKFPSPISPFSNQVSESSGLFAHCSPLHTPSLSCNDVQSWESLEHLHCWMNTTFYKAVDSSWCFMGFLWRRDLFFFSFNTKGLWLAC